MKGVHRKNKFSSPKTVEASVAMAVLEYKLGPKGFERILKKMNVDFGEPSSRLRGFVGSRWPCLCVDVLQSTRPPSKIAGHNT